MAFERRRVDLRRSPTQSEIEHRDRPTADAPLAIVIDRLYSRRTAGEYEAILTKPRSATPFDAQGIDTAGRPQFHKTGKWNLGFASSAVRKLKLYSANAYGRAFSARSGEAILLESGAWLTSTLRYSTVRSSGEVFR